MTPGKVWVFSLFACERKHSAVGVIHRSGRDRGVCILNAGEPARIGGDVITNKFL